MAKIYDAIAIGLTRDELRQALRAWMGNKTSIYDYIVTDVSLHPGSKYVIRFTVAPPLAKADQDAIKQPADEKETV